MAYWSRRGFLSAGLAAGASLALPPPQPAFSGAHPSAAAQDWFIPESELPVLHLDPAASVAAGRIVTHGLARSEMPWGAVILVPGGAPIPARWWGIRVRRQTGLKDGARIVIRSADPVNPAHLAAPGKEGVLELQNLSDRRVLFAVEDMALSAGPGGDAVRIDRASAVHLRNLTVTGGKNGIFATHHPTDIEIDGCQIRHGGRSDGYTHNVYFGYVRRVQIRRSRIHAAAAPGHCFKCYAQSLDARNNIFAHYLEPPDLASGYFGGLPLVDRGAWGETIMVDNLLVRRGPVRQTVIDLRNRSFPPGFRPHVQPGWGTEAVQHEAVDNRDPHNPHLFRHLFLRNTLSNGILPSGALDPHAIRHPGTFLRNNGSAPWYANAGGKVAAGTPPPGWQPWHERAVAYLWANRFEGIPPEILAQRWAYRRPEIPTPVLEWRHLPDWARQRAKL